MTDLKELVLQRIASIKPLISEEEKDVAIIKTDYVPNSILEDECFKRVWNDPAAWSGTRRT